MVNAPNPHSTHAATCAYETANNSRNDTRPNSADSVPTYNIVCIKEVAIRTTFSHMINIAGIIYYTCSLVIDIQCTRYKNAFNKRFHRIVCQSNSAKIYSEKNVTEYFRLCIDLMHINPPDTAEGFDGSHHQRYAE